MFSQEQMFLVGARILSDTVSAEQAGGAFARLADVAIRALHRRVEDTVAASHGRIRRQQTALLALGKLGGREMTATSDLDLIIVYDFDAEQPQSDGERPLYGAQYFARLTQRLISALSSQTNYGALYQVDMRLRPSGRSGPVATSIDAFASYQESEAWTWEHMALTRARPVAGDTTLCRRISDGLETVLRRPRDPAKLAVDVADMRRRVAEQTPRPAPWDLKNRRGGLIDLEFIVQYLQLQHAAAMPNVLHRDTAEALRELGAVGALPKRAERELGGAAKLLRNVQAVLTLLIDGSPTVAHLTEADAATLARCAGAVDFGQLGADITDAIARVRSWYDRLVEQPARHAPEMTGDSRK
jgi:[glutamine synthetase] adenylyltransferase / [glutamine synthetase]-adenylyl-L-tyrosine phosphorylase